MKVPPTAEPLRRFPPHKKALPAGASMKYMPDFNESPIKCNLAGSCSSGMINTSIGVSIIFLAMIVLGANSIIYLRMYSGNTVGLFVAFILNKLWTFQHGGPWSPSLAKWLIVASFGYACNLGAVITAHRSLVMNSYIPQFVGVVAYTLVSFFGGRYFAFASAHK